MPSEWGKWISLSILILFFWPTAIVVVAHSPTPSAVKIIASLNEDAKYALAAWLKWWLEKNILFLKSFEYLCFFNNLINSLLRNSLL